MGNRSRRSSISWGKANSKMIALIMFATNDLNSAVGLAIFWLLKGIRLAGDFDQVLA